MDYGLNSKEGFEGLGPGAGMAGPRTILRDRLFKEVERQLSDAGLSGKVVLITGPSGSGKTELARQLTARSSHPAFWISLRETGMSIQGLIESLSGKIRSFAKKDYSEEEYRQSEPSGKGQDLYAAALAELDALLDMTLLRRCSPYCLVFDNWEEAAGSPVHIHVVNRILERLPMSCCLILLSRVHPSGLRLSRIRSEGRLAELKADQLFFDGREMADLARRFDLGIEAAEKAMEMTRGWPALAALVLRRQACGMEGDAAKRDLEGYLKEEVWSQLPLDEKKGLLKLYLAAPFTERLAEHILGEGAPMLLERFAGCFFAETGSSMEFLAFWNELLDSEVGLLTSQEQKETLKGAADWFGQRGRLDRQAELLFQAGMEDEVLDLVEQEVERCGMPSRHELLMEVIRGFSAGFMARHPELYFYMGRALFYLGRLAEASSYLEKALESLGSRTRRATECGILLLEALLLCDDYERCLYYARRLKSKRLPFSPIRFRYKIYEAISLSQLGRGDQALPIWNSAKRLAASHLLPLMPYERAYLLIPKAVFHHLDRSEFREAEGIIDMAISALKVRDPERRLAWAYLFKGGILREKFQLADAMTYLKRALKLSKSSNMALAAHASAIAAFTAAESGRQEVRSMLEELKSLSAFDHTKWSEIFIMLTEALLEEDRQKAGSLAEAAFNLATAARLTFPQAMAAFTAFRIKDALPRARLIKMVEAVMNRAEEMGMTHRVLRCFIILVHLDPGAVDASRLELLGRTLEDADRKGIDFILVNQEPEVRADFLDFCIRRGVWSEDFIHNLAGMGEQGAGLLLNHWDSLPDDSTRIAALRLFRRLCYRPAFGLLKQMADRPGPQPTELRQEALQVLECLDKAPPPPLHICLFGTFSLKVGARPVEKWPRQSAADLFKFLVVNRDKAISFERLADIFWPDKPLKKAKASLWAAASTIRSILEPGIPPKVRSRYLQVSADNYILHLPEGSWIDTEAFERLIKKARIYQNAGQKKEALEALREARSLYRGDFLQEDLYKEWTSFHRERLLRLYSETLEGIGHLCLELGELGEARDAAEELWGLDPFSEEACYIAMKSYMAEGKRVKAVRLYKDFMKKLRQEFDISPGQTLNRLFEEIVSAD